MLSESYESFIIVTHGERGDVRFDGNPGRAGATAEERGLRVAGCLRREISARAAHARFFLPTFHNCHAHTRERDGRGCSSREGSHVRPREQTTRVLSPRDCILLSKWLSASRAACVTVTPCFAELDGPAGHLPSSSPRNLPDPA